MRRYKAILGAYTYEFHREYRYCGSSGKTRFTERAQAGGRFRSPQPPTPAHTPPPPLFGRQLFGKFPTALFPGLRRSCRGSFGFSEFFFPYPTCTYSREYVRLYFPDFSSELRSDRVERGQKFSMFTRYFVKLSNKLRS